MALIGSPDERAYALGKYATSTCRTLLCVLRV